MMTYERIRTRDAIVRLRVLACATDHRNLRHPAGTRLGVRAVTVAKEGTPQGSRVSCVLAYIPSGWARHRDQADLDTPRCGGTAARRAI